MKISVVVMWLLLVMVSNQLYAQIEIIDLNIDTGLLNEPTARQCTKAQKLVDKANGYLKAAQGFDQEMDRLMSSEGRIKQGKVNKMEGKRYYAMLKARPYQFEAYSKIYKALNKQLESDLENSSNSNALDLIDKAKFSYKQGRKFNRKSENSENPDRLIDFIVLSGQQMSKSVGYQLDALKEVKGSAPNEEPRNVVEEKMIADTTKYLPVAQKSVLIAPVPVEDTLQTVNPIVSSIGPEVKPVVLEQTVVPASSVAAAVVVAETAPSASAVESKPLDRAPLTNVYISIQLMATKTSATKEQIKQVYAGSREVLEVKSSDYIRYVVGKFYTLEEAKSTMAAESIKGMVVAIKDNERISVVEAARIIAELNK